MTRSSCQVKDKDVLHQINFFLNYLCTNRSNLWSAVQISPFFKFDIRCYKTDLLS